MSKRQSFNEAELEEAFIKKLVSNFLDVIVIVHFEKESFSGYDLTRFVHKELNVLLSPGTIYATLYSMEREGLLESMTLNKRVFKATEKGLCMGKLLSSPERVGAFFRKILKS
jgi:DNA-binding PadR family transcriptional regulator